MQRVQSLYADTLRICRLQLRVINVYIRCAVNRGRTCSVGGVFAAVDHHCSAAAVTAYRSGAFTVCLGCNVPRIERSAACRMNTAGSALLCVYHGILDINNAVAVCKRSRAALGIRIYRAAVDIRGTACCKYSSAYAVEAGAVAAGRVAACAGNCRVVKHYAAAAYMHRVLVCTGGAVRLSGSACIGTVLSYCAPFCNCGSSAHSSGSTAGTSALPAFTVRLFGRCPLLFTVGTCRRFSVRCAAGSFSVRLIGRCLSVRHCRKFVRRISCDSSRRYYDCSSRHY